MNPKLCRDIKNSNYDEMVVATASKASGIRIAAQLKAQRAVDKVNAARVTNNALRVKREKKPVALKSKAHLPVVIVPHTDRQIRRLIAQRYPTTKDRGRLRAKLRRLIVAQREAKAKAFAAAAAKAA